MNPARRSLRNYETSLAFMLAKDQIASRRATRFPPGGPEAFANIYPGSGEGNPRGGQRRFDSGSFGFSDHRRHGVYYHGGQSAKAGSVLPKCPLQVLLLLKSPAVQQLMNTSYPQ